MSFSAEVGKKFYRQILEVAEKARRKGRPEVVEYIFYPGRPLKLSEAVQVTCIVEAVYHKNIPICLPEDVLDEMGSDEPGPAGDYDS